MRPDPARFSLLLAATLLCTSDAPARPPALPILFDGSSIYGPIGANAALLKLGAPDEQGIAVFAFPAALGKSGIFGARLPGMLPVIEQPWPIPGTPILAVDSLISSNSSGMIAYRSQIQFQSENSIVIAGPIRGPADTGSVREVLVWSLTDVTDPAIDGDGRVYFGARGDDGLSKLYVIDPEANAPTVYLSHWTFLDTILSVVVDGSCRSGAPGEACTIAALFRRETGPAAFHYVWAADLFLDIAPVTAGPFPMSMVSLESVRGEVSLVHNPFSPAGDQPPRVVTVIDDYQALSPPRVTFQYVPGFHFNRMENFCGVRALPGFNPSDPTPIPHGPTDNGIFLFYQACTEGLLLVSPVRRNVPLPMWGQTIDSIQSNPRCINSRGDVAFSIQFADGSSGLFYHPEIRTGCPGDSDGDLIVGFTDITTTLANWGAAFPADGFCVPLGDADFNRSVDFGDVTATLGNWGRNCR